jgi:hypothetical protein
MVMDRNDMTTAITRLFAEIRERNLVDNIDGETLEEMRKLLNRELYDKLMEVISEKD